MITGKQFIDVVKKNISNTSDTTETLGDKILNLIEDLSAQEMKNIIDYGIAWVKEE